MTTQIPEGWYRRSDGSIVPVPARQQRPHPPDARLHPMNNGKTEGWSAAWRAEHRRFAEELDRYAGEHPEDHEWIEKARAQYG